MSNDNENLARPLVSIVFFDAFEMCVQDIYHYAYPTPADLQHIR